MSRALRPVKFQLDYYMSAQFAGVAVALRSGLYAKAGIQLEVLPTCPPGEEAAVVSGGFRQERGASLWVGCMEQNTLVPAIAAGLRVKAVAAMFGRTPLCLAGLPGSELRARAMGHGGAPFRVGAHTDTRDLLQRILPGAAICDLPREEKLQSLRSGEVDAVQAYDVTETLRLAEELGTPPEVLRLEDGAAFPGVSLGYSQVLFTPASALEATGHRATLQAFLQATFQGWRRALRDPAGAAGAVLELQGASDHWVSSHDFAERSVGLCCEYVKRTMRCGQLGTIDASQWRQAGAWLGATAPVDGSLDGSVWNPDDRHVDAHPVAECVHSKTRQLAAEALAKHGAPPRLVVVTVGSAALGSTHPDGARRLQLFAPADGSWFSKKETGAAVGVAVEEVNLAAGTTTQELVQELMRHSDADGIQLMWPLPPGIDAAKAHAAIPLAKDVDGIHFRGLPDAALARTAGAHPPVTCGGVLRILDHYNVDVRGLRVVLIGRSWLLGQPLAHLLGARGATVTLVHHCDAGLEVHCRAADVVISAAGAPRVLRGSWIQPGAVVINIGTTFADDGLVPDVAPLQELGHAGLVVRSVGPISVAMLLRNVAESAARRPAREAGATEATTALAEGAALQRLEDIPGWSLAADEDGRTVLRRDFKLPSYAAAVAFVNSVSGEAEQMNHHPNLRIAHECANGATVTAEISTYAIGALSDFDFELAGRINALQEDGRGQAKHAPDVRMHDFSYSLPDELIARYPASPRHQSRLLVALPDRRGGLAAQLGGIAAGPGPQDKVFRDLPALLPPSVHLVGNDSRVFAARILATQPPGHETPVEVMFLAPESPDANPAAALARPCAGQIWRCMVRSAIKVPGPSMRARTASGAEIRMRVERLYSPWLEEGEPDGVEAAVRLAADDPDLTARDAFELLGQVPLPPYMRRAAEAADSAAYQTVYASDGACGSVAAATAGLHFTPEVLGALEAKGVRWSSLALHVGAGTFRPVVAERIAEHGMHAETFSVGLGALEDLIASLDAGRPIVPVGTTTVRTLESLYWLGASPGKPRVLGQWDAYRLEAEGAQPTAAAALRRLHDHAVSKGDASVHGTTSLCIVPGYRFRLCDALITNFHQPDSTLLLLVAALAGRDVLLDSYRHAVEQHYRFLSYGDASMFFNAARC